MPVHSGSWLYPPQEPVACPRGAPLLIACTRGTLLPKGLPVGRESYSCGGLPLLLSPSQQWCLTSLRAQPPPGFPRLWHFVPQPMTLCSLAPQAECTQPTLVLSPDLTPRAVCQCPALTQVSQAVMSRMVVMVCVQLSLCFPSSVLLLHSSPRFPGPSVSPSVRWLPRGWFLPSFTAPSQECRSHPDPLPPFFLFSFCSTQ